jgi:hypothetical protein
MGKANYGYSIPLTMFLMSLALIGWPVLEFIFVAMVSIAIAATGFYCFLFFAALADNIIDWFYEMR